MASYSKMPDGSWSVRFRVTDGLGKITQKRLSGFDRKSDAERGYRLFMDSYVPFEAVSQSKGMTFDDVVAQFKHYYIHEVKESTYIATVGHINNFLVPYFGKKVFNDITTIDIANWKIEVNSLTYKKNNIKLSYNYTYKSTLFSALSSIYTFAFKFLGIHSNLASRVGDFKRDNMPTKKIDFWTLEEYSEFAAGYLEDSYKELKAKTIFMTLYYTGCRKGELSALTWADYNGKALSINKTSSRKTLDGTYKITSPKTQNSERVTDLPETLIAQLDKYLVATKKNGEATQNNYIFGGKQILPEQTISNWFKMIVARSGVRKIRIHDLRHSHVSLLINTCGYDLSMLFVIADRIGDTTEQILKTYGHLFPSKKADILATLNKIL